MGEVFAARGRAVFVCFFVWSSGEELFRVHGYSFLNWTSGWNKTKQLNIGGLPPAFVGVFGHFCNYSFIWSLHTTLSQNFRSLGSQSQVSNFETRVSKSRKVLNAPFYTSPLLQLPYSPRWWMLTKDNSNELQSNFQRLLSIFSTFISELYPIQTL